MDLNNRRTGKHATKLRALGLLGHSDPTHASSVSNLMCKYYGVWFHYHFRINRSTRRYHLSCNSQLINSLEHVEVHIKYHAKLGGQIRWNLRSPGNTTSNILPGRYLDIHKDMDVKVVSVQFWGEDPNGWWTLWAEIEDDNHEGKIY